jgi:hypothetical protein
MIRRRLDQLTTYVPTYLLTYLTFHATPQECCEDKFLQVLEVVM